LAFAEHIGHAGFASDMRLNLGYVQIRRGNLDGARGTSERALADARARGDGHVAAAALHNLFMVAVRCEDAVTASRRLLEMFAIMPGEAGATIPFAVEGAAALAARAGDHELAATLLGATPPVAARVYVVELELRLEAERAACAALG